MNLATLPISLSDYLRTSFHPGYDFVDGEVVERNSGEFDHAEVQAFLTSWFFQHRQEWDIRVLPEIAFGFLRGECESQMCGSSTASPDLTNAWVITVRWK